MNSTSGSGVLNINGIECRYVPPVGFLLGKTLRYIDTYGLLPLIQKLSFDPLTKRWSPPNLLITGPKGGGKSLLFAYIAQENDIPYLAVDCSEETKERHLKGGFVAKSGETPFVLGTITNAIQVANECGVAMLVFEEINALSPQMQKMLNPLTDFRRKVEVPELGTRFSLTTGSTLFVCGTMNPTVYGGTYELNADLKSRFVEIEVPYPPPAAEKRILREMAPVGHIPNEDVLDKLVDIAKETRQDTVDYALSTRDLVQLLESCLRVGWDETLFLLAQKFSPEQRKLVVDRIRDITRIGVAKDLAERARLLKLTI
jgi:AAA+ superfamily predicted ATPase